MLIKAHTQCKRYECVWAFLSVLIEVKVSDDKFSSSLFRFHSFLKDATPVQNIISFFKSAIQPPASAGRGQNRIMTVNLDEGVSDEILWKISQQEGQLLITTDKGFTEYREELHHGVLIVRLRQPNRRKIHQRVRRSTFIFQNNLLNLAIMNQTS